jgi:hypothetical protein
MSDKDSGNKKIKMKHSELTETLKEVAKAAAVAAATAAVAEVLKLMSQSAKSKGGLAGIGDALGAAAGAALAGKNIGGGRSDDEDSPEERAVAVEGDEGTQEAESRPRSKGKSRKSTKKHKRRDANG